LGKQVGLDEPTLAALVEAALLHDVGKTQIPLDLVRKPGALDTSERRTIEAHPTLGAEILIQTEGLHPLTPTVALEHHRGVKGTGYPDLGEAIPHPMSQIVSVADIYEAVTGARTYQAPTPPEKACMILARMAGEKLNTGLVKKFVNTITFFPVGSLVRTNRNELGLVVETNRREPLHPVLALVDEETYTPTGRVDTSERESSGGYARHITQSMPAPDGLDLRVFLEPSKAA
jgi:HD-GYP domain-containing protein (c-di-GMP phosphodiesterase class II)